MKKNLLLSALMLLGSSRLISGPVDVSVARNAGETFTRSRFTMPLKSDEMRLVKTTDAYYIFNVGAKGFVIVSADDCFRPIIGYSDEGTFNAENPSPEMMYYLDNLSQGRQAALRASVKADAKVEGEWAALLNGEQLTPRNDRKGSFYLVETRWNQDYPYNKFCPREDNGARTYAGCVATAMSQVMNYWKYPTRGFGQHTYFHYQYGEISADFSSTDYDFDLMTRSIDATSPVENIDAIAEFMYHCGVAVDMGYGTDGSGAYSQDVPEAVMKYFGYTNCCRMYNRDSYSLEDFQALLKNQFDMGWPCYYSGSDTDGGGGHAFVCDGYDDNDMFHFNWGWSGSGDGFFVIDGLNVSSYAFNSGQAVVANFVPSEVFSHTAKAPGSFTAIPNGDDEFSVTLSWINPTATLDGHLLDAIDLIEILRDGEIVHVIENPSLGEAMTYVDVAGKPVSVDYSVRAVYQGFRGHHASVNGINLGPTCTWMVNLSSERAGGWGNGAVSFVNASGVEVAVLSADKAESEYQVEIPQGRISIQWTAPSDSLEIGIEILDALEQPVFTYQGPSYAMPSGVFYEMVNTCGEKAGVDKPSGLQASAVEDDVLLSWTGIADPGYGYSIYRDGLYYAMTDETTYTDANAAQEYHSYFVTAFCKEGETEPSNTVCAIVEDDKSPLNLDFEFLQNNKLRLTWEKPENTEDLSGFSIYRRALGQDYERIKVCNANTLQYTENSVPENGHRYYYKVVGVYQQGAVLSTPARSLKHPDQYFVEVNRTIIPSNLVLEEQRESSLSLQWETALLAEAYNVYCNGELVAEGLIEPYFEDTVRGDALMYQVKGVLNGVESSPSNSVYYGNYSIGENDMVDAVLYPNPSKGLVNVCVEGLRKVAVFNVTGQQVISCIANSPEMTINLADLDSGVYYFNVLTDKGRLVKKVVLIK